jgi:outer membrane receptor protein involved in Fe transport
MASAELGNYHQKRFEGMINIPIVDDRLDIRFAGEWTKRQGYSFNSLTDARIDGRDLWSGRATIGLKPADNVQMYLVWEHFSEDDDRLRSSKQLCNRSPDVTEVNGNVVREDTGSILGAIRPFLNQGCQAASLYSPDSFQVVNGLALSYYGATGTIGGPVYPKFDPYANAVNSPNLRVIESMLEPTYQAKNDVVELNTDYNMTPTLTLTSQTAFSHDFLWGSQDYNRFNSQPGAFNPGGPSGTLVVSPDGVFCDPQLGCSDRLVAQDLVREYAWQLSQEFRLASHFSGPFNFSVGGNYMHYETHENYYVFINSLTALAAVQDATQPGSAGQYIPGVTDGFNCLPDGPIPGNPKQGGQVFACIYMDPNPITSLNDQGHNYFLSQNPYNLNSYATFGEAYYNITPDLKLIGGVRWTRDEKHFPLMPSWLLSGNSYGYPVTGIVDQEWSEITGRFAANWTPKLSFTDQTLIYASFARGYKAGGANPPPATPVGGNAVGSYQSAVHPLTFDPEFINAFELGTKNTLLDGALTLNGSLFQYIYKGYQISQIVDRTSVNLNFDAHINGAELEATWEPIPGLRFNFGGGYENARFDKGSQAIDLIDRTAGNTDWMVIKPYPTAPSNCIFPTYVIAAYVRPYSEGGSGGLSLCNTYTFYPTLDPVTGATYTPNPTVRGSEGPSAGSIPAGYPGYLPTSAPNNGEGFYKDIGNNMMPNAPPFTASLGAQYSMPVSSDWAVTFRADGYWQDNSWWRVFNDNEYDKLHGYATMNLTLILTSQAGWQVMLYDKNLFNTTAITGAFLNSDDSGLTTNVFLTDPKLIGVRVTKNW